MTSIRLRDRVWKVRSQQNLGDRIHFELLDPATGDLLQTLCPPEEFEPLTEAPPVLSDRARAPWQVWQDRHEALAFSAWKESEFAAFFAGRISPEPYQFAPASRLFNLPRPNLLIADDVGLGKTIEAGICMLEMMARGRGRRILLIVPPSLISQWQSEMLEKFQLRFDSLENAAAVERMQTSLAEGIRPWAYLSKVVTSIEFMKKREVARAALDFPWDMIVVDEAHYISESGSAQNPYTTARTRLGRMLRDKTQSLLLLTATPHNGFRHSFRSLLELIEPADATLAGNEDVVRRRVGRNMIRRLKSQIHRTNEAGETAPAFPVREPVACIAVTDLPEADRDIIHKVSAYCSQTARAAESSDDRDLVSFAMQIVKKRMLSSRNALRQTVLNRLQAMKSHEETEAPPTKAEIRELQSDLPLSEFMQESIESRLLRVAVTRDVKRRNAEKRQLQSIAKLLEKAVAQPDPKIAKLITDLETAVLSVPGEKAIIFTEYRDTLEALKGALAAHPGFSETFTELTGGLSPAQRQARIVRFHESDCRLLLATDAASEGLNLQRMCRRIYHVELPWNPNRMEQRNGRVDRHGQTRAPIIKYLMYPDSPEDRILDALARKIATMQSDRVSTPDMLGVCAECRIEETLTRLNAEVPDEAAERQVLETFEERQNIFVRDLGGMLASGTQYGAQFDPASCSADPLLSDDLEFERFMLRRLNGHLKAAATAHCWSLKTPRELLGPRVEASYASVTFRRSVAVTLPARDVEFIHRMHPLFQAIVTEANLALTMTPDSQASSQRLAVRRWSGIKGRPQAVFTFLDPAGDRELLTLCAFDAAGKSAPTTWGELRSMQAEAPGEVAWPEVMKQFGSGFAELQQRAAEEALRRQQDRLEEQSRKRASVTSVLREDAAQYRTDRLLEIDEDERTQRLGNQQQLDLFREAPTGFQAQRAAVDTHFQQRIKEIAAFEQVQAPAAPQPLGVLFIFPVEG
jgi:ERCC4-related helicase